MPDQTREELLAENASLKAERDAVPQSWGDRLLSGLDWIVHNKTTIIVALLMMRAAYREVFPSTDHAAVQQISERAASDEVQAKTPAIVKKASDKAVDKVAETIPIVPPTPVPPPSPIIAPPSISSIKIILYTTAALDAKAILADAEVKNLSATIVVDSGVYAPGSTYPFKDRSIPVPCAALIQGGVVVDVQPFATAADIVKLVKK